MLIFFAVMVGALANVCGFLAAGWWFERSRFEEFIEARRALEDLKRGQDRLEDIRRRYLDRPPSE
jgi:hypothetical protein